MSAGTDVDMNEYREGFFEGGGKGVGERSFGCWKEAQALLKACSSVPPNRFYTRPELLDCPTFKEKVLIADCIFSMKISAYRKWLNLEKIKHLR